MTEINNFQNFGVNKIQTKKINNEEKIEKPPVEQTETNYVQDTGVLGRSQVNFKGGDITKSVDEAIAAMNKNPEIMAQCDCLFEDTYEDLVKNKKMDPTDAYFAASEIAGQTAEIASECGI